MWFCFKVRFRSMLSSSPYSPSIGLLIHVLQ